MSYIMDNSQDQQVFVNSFARASGISNNFTFQMNIKPGNDFDRVVVLSAAMPKSYYSITQGYNYCLLTEGNQSIKITIPPGFYNQLNLSVLMASLLTAGSASLGNNYVYTSPVANSSTQIVTGGFNFNVNTIAKAISLGFDSITLLNDLLGFNKPSTNTFTQGASTSSLQSVNVMDMQPNHCVVIHSNLVNAAFSGTNNQSDILCILHANNGTPSLASISYICPDPKFFSVALAKGFSGSANFYLTDEDGTVLNMNGVDWNCLLKFYKSDQTPELLRNLAKLITLKIEDHISEDQNEKKDEIKTDKTDNNV